MNPDTIINSIQAPKQVMMYTGLLTSLHIETGMSENLNLVLIIHSERLTDWLIYWLALIDRSLPFTSFP